jgi:type 1 fimbriae regulatory protein FimB
MVVVKARADTENAVDTHRKHFLTEAEIEGFLKAARKGRHGIRNFAMLLLAYRHGLRVSELVNMRVADVDLDIGRLFVRRCKRSLSTNQPLDGDEIRAVRAWLRKRMAAPCCNSPLLFLSERGPMTRQAVNYLVAEIGKRAAFTAHVHPHMLRHSLWVRAGEQRLRHAPNSGLLRAQKHPAHPTLHANGCSSF